MTERASALIEIASFLDENIGGLAMAICWEPRSTLDVDASVWVEPESFD